jgi:endonuclease/exonuclease/phosphatase family metal-dependent hydrolase
VGRRSANGGRAIIAVLLILAAACSSDDGSDRSDGSAADPARSAEATEPVRVLTFNLLHGLFCPPDTDWCQAPDRVQIFTELVEDAGCPDLVGLQEIGERLEQVLPAALGTVCDGTYEVAWQPVASPDREMVLSRLPIVDRGYLDIANFPWEAYWVRVNHPDQGDVDFLTAHFASSANNPPCAPDRCPPACPVGMITNECHAHEVVDFLAERPDGAALTIASGDFNASPTSATVATLLEAGFVDTWLEAGNPECDPTSHAGCTGGGAQPEPFVGMDTPEGPGYDERIDYVMVQPGPDCDLAVAAEPFAGEPRAEPLNGLWWPADHAGVLAELRCD